MLCFRCEHRAKFLEGGSRPRYECGDIERSNAGCYMFTPCRPVVVKPNEGDKRPMFGPNMIAGRYTAVELDDEMELTIRKREKGFTLYWVPDGRITPT